MTGVQSALLIRGVGRGVEFDSPSPPHAASNIATASSHILTSLLFQMDFRHNSPSPLEGKLGGEINLFSKLSLGMVTIYSPINHS
jgi:hypothetical protein